MSKLEFRHADGNDGSHYYWMGKRKRRGFWSLMRWLLRS